MPRLRVSPEIDRDAFQRASFLFDLAHPKLPETAVQALAEEVIIRMERSRRLPCCDDPAHAGPHVTALCDALLEDDPQRATDMVLASHANGATVDFICLCHLAGVARELGKRWDEDRLSSAEVIIGAGRIYAIMRGLRRLFAVEEPLRPDRFRAVLVATPGEVHTLGVTMAADHLRRFGWHISLRTGMTHDELVADLGQTDYPIIGLAASSTSMIFPLARLIVALRVSNPAAWILVSGKIAELEPGLQALVDADAVAADLASAEAMMENRMRPDGRLHLI